MKQEGIRSLGLFLRRSRKMFILWSPEYFTRLWCCFEVAAFDQALREDKRQPSRDIVLRPVQIGQVLAILYVAIIVAACTTQALPVATGEAGVGSNLETTFE